MNKNQYVEYYNDLGKFKELHVEDLFCKNESEGANGSLPFFVWCDTIAMTIARKSFFVSLSFICSICIIFVTIS